MTVTFSYGSVADLDLVVSMGMVDGITQAAGQIEAVLVD
jgi:hypothetical protein